MTDKLRELEPVRVYLGTLLVAVVGVLVTLGVVEGESAAIWVGLGTAVLGVPAVEMARNRVTPTVKADRPQVHVVPLDQVARELNLAAQAVVNDIGHAVRAATESATPPPADTEGNPYL